MNPLTSPNPKLSAIETSAMAGLLASCITQAMARGTGLLMTRDLYAGRHAWRCAYPPSGLSLDGLAEWAKRNQIFLRAGDRYLNADEVAAQHAELG